MCLYVNKHHPIVVYKHGLFIVMNFNMATQSVYIMQTIPLRLINNCNILSHHI